MQTETLEIFRSGTDVLIKGSGIKGVIEKIIIGDKSVITYQVICYIPERHQVQCGEFELEVIRNCTESQTLGFNNGVAKEEINIYLDEDDKLLYLDENDKIKANVFKMSKEEVDAMNTLSTAPSGDDAQGEDDEKKTEKKED